MPYIIKKKVNDTIYTLQDDRIGASWVQNTKRPAKWDTLKDAQDWCSISQRKLDDIQIECVETGQQYPAIYAHSVY